MDAMMTEILTDVAARPDAWAEACRTVARMGCEDVELGRVKHAAWHKVVTRHPSIVPDATVNALRDAVVAHPVGARLTDRTVLTAMAGAWPMLLALSAWPECAAMLDLPSTALVKIIHAGEEPVCHQAVLLLVGALAREGTQ